MFFYRILLATVFLLTKVVFANTVTVYNYTPYEYQLRSSVPGWSAYNHPCYAQNSTTIYAAFPRAKFTYNSDKSSRLIPIPAAVYIGDSTSFVVIPPRFLDSQYVHVVTTGTPDSYIEFFKNKKYGIYATQYGRKLFADDCKFLHGMISGMYWTGDFWSSTGPQKVCSVYWPLKLPLLGKPQTINFSPCMVANADQVFTDDAITVINTLSRGSVEFPPGSSYAPMWPNSLNTLEIHLLHPFKPSPLLPGGRALVSPHPMEHR